MPLFLVFGIPVRVVAPCAQRAGFARGFARGADAAAVVDQPVVRAAPLIFGNGLHELMLGLEHIRRVRQPQPIGDAENMRIDGDGVLAERAAHDDVRRLASHARQGFQSVVIRGHFAAEAGDQLPRHQHKVFGLVVGLITVLIAANAPAKHAAKVSPITAVSGNAGHEKTMRYSPYVGFGKIESLLGVSHAISGKKNLFLMTGSFALSIILFLSFSIMVDFVDYLIPQSAATSDIDIASADGNAIPWELLTTIREMDGVKEVYGRRSVFDVSAKLNDDTNFSGTVDLISYDDFDLQCLKKDSALKRGSDLSKVFGDSNFVLATSDQDSTWKIGDTVQIGDETLTIAGLLKNDPFSENGLTNGKLTLITSDETFVRLTGEEGYSLVLIQTTGDVTDENVQAIQNSVDQTYSFRDKRDERTTGTYMAFVFCVYAFLAIIALVTVMNIVNSISMSVSARMKQYGAMRAVGMDERQMTKMIACEAFTYAVLGCVVGCAIGLPLSKSLYDFLIAGHFPSAVWQFPITSLGVILLFVSIAAIAAVYAPAKRIRNMSITATINEL